MPTSFSRHSGHTIEALKLEPLVIYTHSDCDQFNVNDILTGDDSKIYSVAEIRFLSGRLYRVTLLSAA